MTLPVGPAAVERVEGGTAEQPVDLGRDPFGFCPLVRRLVQGDRRVPARSRRRTGGGAQPPARHQGAGCDRLQRAGHDAGGGAVVRGQLDRRDGREVSGEAEEEAHVTAAEPVDCLIRIPDHSQVAARGLVRGQVAQQLVLPLVDVLVLIDADARPALAQRRRQIRFPPQQGGGQLHQAVEINQAAGG